MVKIHIRDNAQLAGFALPTVLIISVILLAIGASTLQVSSALSRVLIDQHWNREAKAAAQAGVSFTSSCVKRSAIKWATNLTPSLGCNGVAISPAKSLYINSDTSAAASPSKWRSTYTASPPVSGVDNVLRSRVVGKVEVLGPSSVITKTYTWDYNIVLDTGGSKVQIVSGLLSTCVINGQLKVYCAGYNEHGQLGDGTTTDQLTPALFQLPLNTTVSSVQANVVHTCVLTTDLEMYCAGYNGNGQLGNGNTINQSIPVKFNITGSPKVTGMAPGTFSSCALTSEQQVYCAGLNSFGQLGNGGTTDQSTPTPFILPPSERAAAVEAGSYHNCVLTYSQSVYCSGYNQFGQIGNNSVINQPLPVKFILPAGKSARKLITHFYYNNTCVISTDQQLYCSGYNGQGQLGNGTVIDQPIPTNFILPAGTTVESVSISAYNICVVTGKQEAYCSGRNDYGQLGDGTTIIRTLPVKFNLPAGKKAIKALSGGVHICVLTTSQEIYCSGYNASGQLGNGTTTSTTNPTKLQIPITKRAYELGPGSFHTCILTTDRIIYCNGNNQYGQLGDGSTTNRLIPIEFQMF